MRRRETTRGKVLYYLGGASAIAGVLFIGLALRVVKNTTGLEGMETVHRLLAASLVFMIVGMILHRSQIKQF